MSAAEIFLHLQTWTPYLLGGFGWNVLISLIALGIGTAVGAVLACARLSPSASVSKAGLVITKIFRNIPSLAFVFYLTVLLPTEVTFWGSIHVIPGWIKASLAFSAAQIGFTSDQLGPAIQAWRQRQHGAALLFIPNWVNGFIITILASSGASLVGVSELVSRCNTVINATGSSDLMVPFYFYASLIFMVFCLPVSLAMKKVQMILQAKLKKPEVNTAFERDLTSDVALIPSLADELACWAARHFVPEQVIFSVNLVLDELITNVVEHGIGVGNPGSIHLSVRIEWYAIPTRGALLIELHDRAPAFNPFEVPPPDISLGIEEREIGGLGVHFVRTFMDTWDYQRTEDGQNIVYLQKAFMNLDKDAPEVV